MSIKITSEPGSPHEQSVWTLSQAVGWIATRTAAGALVGARSDVFSLTLFATGGPMDGAIARSAWRELQTALVEGKITASAIAIEADKSEYPMEISPFLWRHLSSDVRDRWRSSSKSGREFKLIKVCAADVLRLWPLPGKDPNASHAAKPLARHRGPKISVFDRVVTEMKRMRDHARLDAMKEEEMASAFNASRYTCRKARILVLSETNLDN